MSRVAFACGLMVFALVSAAQAEDVSTDKVPAELRPIAYLAGGEWTINDKWLSGEPIKARATYEWTLGGKFMLASTFVQAPDGKEYQRYLSVFGVEDGKISNHGFTYDGTYTKLLSTPTDDGSLLLEWEVGPEGQKTKLKQQVTRVDDNKFRWQIWMQQNDQWQPIMDAYWTRKE